MASLHRRGGWRGCRATCPTLNKGLSSTADAGPRATRWNRCSRTRDSCRALEWSLPLRVIDVTAAMTGSRATFATTEASARCAEQSHRRQDCGKCPNSEAARRGSGRAQTGAAPTPAGRGREVLGRHSRQSKTAQGTAAERVAALERGSRRCRRPRTARAAQATACGTRRVHGAAPIACHARQAGRGRCCCRAWAARRARVAWVRAREPKAPAVRRGSTQGSVWASGWLGHCRLSTFARQDVSAALPVATCGRARRRQFAHPPATRRMRAHLAALSCRLGILLHLGHAQLFHVGFASVVSAVWSLLSACRSHCRCPGPACSSITGAVFLWLYQEQPPLEQGLSSTPAYGRSLCMAQLLR